MIVASVSVSPYELFEIRRISCFFFIFCHLTASFPFFFPSRLFCGQGDYIVNCLKAPVLNAGALTHSL